MPHSGQITGTLDSSWLIELAKGGQLAAESEEEIEYIPVATMPGVVLVWSIAQPIEGDAACPLGRFRGDVGGQHVCSGVCQG